MTGAVEWVRGCAKAWIEDVVAPSLTEHTENSNLKEPEHRRDSTYGWSTSPFNEFRSDAGPVKHILEAKVSNIPGHEPGSQPRRRY